MIEIAKISGIGEYEEQRRKNGDEEDALYSVPGSKVFLVIHPKTIEVRCDGKLSKVLCEKYESVMQSRYFGRGGIEIVDSGQLAQDELDDLVRLSYNLTLAQEVEE